MKSKEEVLEEIQNAFTKKLEKVRNDKSRDVYDKIVEVDILLNTMKFLKDYDENIKILNDYIKKNRFDKER